MPATSVRQRKLFAIAEHDPEALNPENKHLADLPHKTLHDFASTSEKGLPQTAHHADGRRPIIAPPRQPMGFVMREIRGATMPTPRSDRVAHFKADGEAGRPGWMDRMHPHMADGGQLSDAFKHAGEPGHSLHASLGIPKDKKIPIGRMESAAHSGKPKVRRQAQAALNMHRAMMADGGVACYT